eukprot:11223102-Lingulodinium_polyedra.AAC.1
MEGASVWLLPSWSNPRGDTGVCCPVVGWPVHKAGSSQEHFASQCGLGGILQLSRVCLQFAGSSPAARRQLASSSPAAR